jgi:ABC-type amino acid transport substrate-binding protein
MLSRLGAGRGDLAVGTLTITPERLKLVDFSDPLVMGVKEIAVTGSHSPAIHSLGDLSGQEVFVRKKPYLNSRNPTIHCLRDNLLGD